MARTRSATTCLKATSIHWSLSPEMEFLQGLDHNLGLALPLSLMGPPTR